MIFYSLLLALFCLTLPSVRPRLSMAGEKPRREGEVGFELEWPRAGERAQSV